MIQSRKITDKNKIKIAEFIPADDLKQMKNLADGVSALLVKNGHQNRPFNKINSILGHGVSSNNLKLFAMHIGDFNEEENKDILTLLGGKFNDINKKKNPIFDSTPINHEILDALKSKNIIVDHRPYKNSLRVYHTKQK